MLPYRDVPSTMVLGSLSLISKALKALTYSIAIESGTLGGRA
jgi:hypothetical protein